MTPLRLGIGMQHLHESTPSSPYGGAPCGFVGGSGPPCGVLSCPVGHRCDTDVPVAVLAHIALRGLGVGTNHVGSCICWWPRRHALQLALAGWLGMSPGLILVQRCLRSPSSLRGEWRPVS